MDIESQLADNNANSPFSGRIMIYTHDTYGLGNIRRMLAIAERMADAHPLANILVVTGSPMQHGFRVKPSIDFIKLPCLSRDKSGQYAPRSLGMSLASTLAVRSDLISVAYRHFKPDILLVDKKPLGVHAELTSLFRLIKTEVNPPIVTLVLRDILDTPLSTRQIWSKNSYHQIIEEHYDLVLVAGQPEVFDMEEAYGFPATTMEKLRYCGYIDAANDSDRPRFHTVNGRQKPPRVLVTVGGGADGSYIVEHCIQALRLCRMGSSHAFTVSIILGPEMTKTERQRLTRLTEGLQGLEMIDFTNNMASEIAAADLVVGMCGYNTTCEVLSAGKYMIAIPRTTPVKEQLLRASKLEALGLLKMLHPDKLSPCKLLQTINGALRGTRTPCRIPLDFSGLDRIEYWLTAASRQRQATHCARDMQRPAAKTEGM